MNRPSRSTSMALAEEPHRLCLWLGTQNDTEKHPKFPRLFVCLTVLPPSSPEHSYDFFVSSSFSFNCPELTSVNLYVRMDIFFSILSALLCLGGQCCSASWSVYDLSHVLDPDILPQHVSRGDYRGGCACLDTHISPRVLIY